MTHDPLDDQLDWLNLEDVTARFDIGDVERAERWIEHVAGHPDTDPTLRIIATGMAAMIEHLRDQAWAQRQIVELLEATTPHDALHALNQTRDAR